MTVRLPAHIQQRIDDANAKLKLRMQELEGEAEDNRERNAEARREYLAEIETKRQAERDRAHEQEEARLAPEKARRLRAFLIEHPDLDEQTFEKKTWPLIREELVGKDAIKNRYLAQARGGHGG